MFSTRLVACAVALLAMAATATFAASGVPGQIQQLPGNAGCLSEFDSEGACKATAFLQGPSSACGLARRPGRLCRQLQRQRRCCVLPQPDRRALTSSPTRKDASARRLRAALPAARFEGVTDVAVSPDGRDVYAAASKANAVDAFARGSNGALSQLAGSAGCTSQDGSDGGCATGAGLTSPFAVVVSSDGRNVYAVGQQRRHCVLPGVIRRADGDPVHHGTSARYGREFRCCGDNVFDRVWRSRRSAMSR